MIDRRLERSIVEALESFPVVGLLGSRQVGKTTLARTLVAKLKRKSVYLDLELPSDEAKLADAELYLRPLHDKLVIVDEVQRRGDLFPLLRALVDQKRTPGRFLLLGSASPELVRKSSESLAGRITYFELDPFSLSEVKPTATHFERLWLRGGYPESFLAKDDRQSLLWRDSFVRTFLERDIPQFGLRVPSAQLRRFITMTAHVHGQLWNASTLSKSLSVSAPTVRHYLDILEETFMVRRLEPYYVNVGKRLVKSPKCYIRDSGVLHSLLTIKSRDDLVSNPCLGHSFEGFVIEQVLALLPRNVEAYFYRSSSGVEIDLLLVGLKRKPVAVEVKYSSAPSVGKGFWNGFSDIGCGEGYVIYPGSESYPLAKNLTALSVLELEKIVD